MAPKKTTETPKTTEQKKAELLGSKAGATSEPMVPPELTIDDFKQQIAKKEQDQDELLDQMSSVLSGLGKKGIVIGTVVEGQNRDLDKLAHKTDTEVVKVTEACRKTTTIKNNNSGCIIF